MPTVAYDGGVLLLSPELAGFTGPRFGDFTTGNVLHCSLATLVAEAEQRTAWLPEFWQGVDGCRDTCPHFAFCGGGHAAIRYFEHGAGWTAPVRRTAPPPRSPHLGGVIQHARDHASGHGD
ncbi:hypothetical protein [Streptomyces sp. WMMC1477]|uniref:hypothetical protein n=1 Tax=Streptomyces sp. WMMC1477 TaxID=3015155 RepID=UPI0022B660B5|nr:hypothetical protein [Streptomyces sp. WMMC1477]MCZ7432308.1 hypothetical protein [Streptomyces sp. WMMC1477]